MTTTGVTMVCTTKRVEASEADTGGMLWFSPEPEVKLMSVVNVTSAGRLLSSAMYASPLTFILIVSD